MRAQWDRTVKKAFGEGAEIVFPRFFESKKNQVTLLELDIDGVPRQVIAKYYVWGDGAVEWDVLKKCLRRGIRAPAPVFRKGHVSFMGYIPGSTVRMLRQGLSAFDVALIGRWLGGFHRAFYKSDGTCLLKGDVMLPNFIFNSEDNLLYGIDFEESRRGNPREELAEILAVMMGDFSVKPEDGRKDAVVLCRAYLEEFPMQIEWDRFSGLLIESLNKRKRYMPHLADRYEESIELVKSRGAFLFKIS